MPNYSEITAQIGDADLAFVFFFTPRVTWDHMCETGGEVGQFDWWQYCSTSTSLSNYRLPAQWSGILQFHHWSAREHSFGKGVAEWGSRTKGQGGVSSWRLKKKKWLHQGGSGHKELRICFGWFSWSSRCIWVAVVTVLAVGESGRAIWTHWHPLNLSSEDGKETVKKLYNIKHWC